MAKLPISIFLLLAKIKVVPNEQNLNAAEGRVANSKIVLKNAQIEFKRNKDLFVIEDVGSNID